VKILFALAIAASIVVVPAALAAQSPAKPRDSILGVDKVKHFFISGFVESMTFAGLQAAGANRSPARTAAISATAIVSLGREIHDRKTKGLFSFRDLLWDTIGATAGLILINKTQR
jgi:uncharacterized protein YfiM (DUF2279 family)